MSSEESKKCLDMTNLINVNKTKKIKMLVVSTKWNTFFVEQLTKKLIHESFVLTADDVMLSVEHRKVPGSWELPIAIQSLAQREHFDVIVAVGVLIKGETKHFEHISKAVFQGLMSLQLKLEVPIINGVLTVLNESQIEERIELAKGWAASAICMSQYSK